MKTEALKTVDEPRRVDASLVLADLVDMTHVPENGLRSVEPGEDIYLPTNYLGGEDLVVPSLDIVTPRGNEARLVTLHNSDPKLKKMYKDTVRAVKGGDRRIDEMTYDATVRILDTTGAEGLHHIHDTDFPHTVYHIAKRGNGVLSNVYVTRLGMLESGVPVLGRVTAMRDKKMEYQFFRRIGAGNQKARYNP